LGLGVSGIGYRVSGIGFRVSGSGFRVQGFGFRVAGSLFRVSGFGFQVSGFGYQVSGAWVMTGEEEGGPGVAEVFPRGTFYFLEVALLLPRLRHCVPPTQAGFQGSGFNNHQPSIGHMLPGAKFQGFEHCLVRALNENVNCPSSEGGRYYYHACCQYLGP